MASEEKPFGDYERRLREWLFSHDLVNLPREFKEYLTKHTESAEPKLLHSSLVGAPRNHGRLTTTEFATLSGSGQEQDGDYMELLVDDTNGICWRFIYRTGKTYPWEFIGGPPMYAEVTTDESTASTTYAALATAGPSITLPRAGDYMVSTGFRGYNSTAGAWANLMSYDIGGTAAVDADVVGAGGDAATTTMDSASRTRRKTGLTAVTLTAKYRVTGGTGNFTERWMSVTPVRIS